MPLQQRPHVDKGARRRLQALKSAAAGDRGPGYLSSALLADVAAIDQNVIVVQSRAPRHQRVETSPACILTWVRGIWTCYMYQTSTERLGTVFPAGVPWAAAPFFSSTPFTSTPQNRKSASKRDSLFRILLWPKAGHAHNRGLPLLIQQMP